MYYYMIFTNIFLIIQLFNGDLGIKFIPSNQKTKFNPLLYECDLHKLKIIEDTVKTLVRLFGDSITEELKQKIEKHHGNIETVTKDLVQQSIEKEVFKNHLILFDISLFEMMNKNKNKEYSKQ
ncbi:hypothetical protein RFI_32876, partial [Reticulomyxa filosa]